MSSSSPISLCERPSKTESLNTSRFPSGKESIADSNSSSSILFSSSFSSSTWSVSKSDKVIFFFSALQVSQGEIPYYGVHPSFQFWVVFQRLDGGEDNDKGIVQNVLCCAFVCHIVVAYSHQPAGICLIQIAKGFSVSLLACVYINIRFHRYIFPFC